MKVYKNQLNENDIFDLNQRDECKVAYERFLKNWKKETEKKRLKDRRAIANISKGSFKTHQPVKHQFHNGADSVKQSQDTIKPSLFKVLMMTFGFEFLFAHFFKLLYDITTLILPILLRLIISFTDESNTKDLALSQAWKGYVLAAAFFGTNLIQSILNHQQFNWNLLLGMRINGVLATAVYRKTLVLCNRSKKTTTAGKIVNLMTADTLNVQNAVKNLWGWWSSPLRIGLSMYLLYETIGLSMFAGLSVLVLLGPINFAVMSKVHKLQRDQMFQKDQRVKLLSEVLNGIKILKLNTWEISFRDRISAIRNIELRILFKLILAQIGLTFIWTNSTFLVSLATFGTFILTSSDNFLDAERAFVSISLLNIIRSAVIVAPMTLTDTVKASVSIKRLNNFFNLEELDPDNVLHDDTKADAISIRNGTFTWQSSNCLSSIDISIPSGSLVAIVGQVGSGKSSLLQAILGEMIKVSGTVNIKGSRSYVSQEAWIQNSSLQENILFGCQLNKKFYDQVVYACAMQSDLDMLPSGDKTIIGEQGVDLSGGQKQRVSLARAIYDNTDIILLDDPLSAVDSSVGKHIFNHVIGNNGMLKNKTRVLVTHNLRLLPKVDKIVVMVDGAVAEIGSYEELVSKNGALTRCFKNLSLGDSLVKDPSPVDGDKNISLSISETSEPSQSEDDKEDLLAISEENVLTAWETNDVPHTDIDELETTENKTNALDYKKNPSIKKSITDENVIQGKVKIGVFLTYIKTFGVKYAILGMFWFGVFQAASVFSSIWLSEWASDEVLTNVSIATSNSTIFTEKNNYYLGIYGLAGVLQAIVIIAFIAVFVTRSKSVSKTLHSKMLDHVVRAPITFFDATPNGRIVNRFSTDINTIDSELPMTVVLWLQMVFYLLAIMVVITYSSRYFGIVIVPFFVIFVVIQRAYVPTSTQLKRLHSQTRSAIYSHISETVLGAYTIRALQAQGRFIDMADERIDYNHRIEYAGKTTNRWLGIRLEFLGNITIVAVVIFALMARGSIDGAIIGLSISYALQITDTLTWMVRVQNDLEINVVSIERVKEYTEIHEETIEDTQYKPDAEWPKTGVIEFRNYSTGFKHGSELVLKDIEISIEDGEKVGIVGRTGAGKSSLALALFRLLEPTAGSIVVDGENICEMGLYECRKHFTIIPQKPVLFSGSIRMNLDPLEEYNDTEIWQALEHAHLKDFIQNMPAQLEYNCGEGGENLNIGHKQLVCIARCLLRKSKILVLDEATAAIDMETDDLIQQTIREEFTECTVLTIAHRLNTIMDYDRIVVLSEGRVKEFDTPANLMKNTDGLFSKMLNDASHTEE